MGAGILKYFKPGTASIVLLTLLIIASLFFLAQAPQDAREIKPAYIALFGIILVELFILVVLISKGLFRLLRQRRNEAIGSRLTLRLFMLFISLSLIPVFIVYFFSLQFIFKGIDSWLSQEVGGTLNSAFDLSQTVLQNQSGEYLLLTRKMADSLQNTDPAQLASVLESGASGSGILDQLRIKHHVQELVIVSLNGEVLVYSGARQAPTGFVLPERDEEEFYYDIKEIDDSGDLYINTFAHLTGIVAAGKSYFLSALFPVNPRLSQLIKEVQATYADYQKVIFLRPFLKTSFTITLSLVLLLCLLTAIWAAFYAATRIVYPLRVLAIGTRAIAAGHYRKQLPQTSHDEIGLLVSSFNKMAHNIALAQDEAARHQEDVERQHAHLEAILGNISSGVIVLDPSLNLKTVNKSAESILETALSPCIGQAVNTVDVQDEGVRQLFDLFYQQAKTYTKKEWELEQTLAIHGKRRTLTCKGTPLLVSGLAQGHVILLSDITALMQAQKNAAWSEVAERLAHEIKNPLTPIQLSAERLIRKFEHTSREEFLPILKRSIHTITQQVDTLKEMLNAFNEYARPPKINLKKTLLHTLIKEVVDLYYGLSPQANFVLDLDKNIPPMFLDHGRIRQLLHNLIKNSLEACVEQQSIEIRISTAFITDADTPYITLSVEDNGKGFSGDMLGRIFDPYVTNKVKGSGLGLAIAKKIVDEHNGSIQAQTSFAGGACIMMQFPVSYP